VTYTPLHNPRARLSDRRNRRELAIGGETAASLRQLLSINFWSGLKLGLRDDRREDSGAETLPEGRIRLFVDTLLLPIRG